MPDRRSSGISAGPAMPSAISLLSCALLRRPCMLIIKYGAMREWLSVHDRDSEHEKPKDLMREGGCEWCLIEQRDNPENRLQGHRAGQNNRAPDGVRGSRSIEGVEDRQGP